MVKSKIPLGSVVMDEFSLFLCTFIDWQKSLQYACISSIMKGSKPLIIFFHKVTKRGVFQEYNKFIYL